MTFNSHHIKPLSFLTLLLGIGICVIANTPKTSIYQSAKTIIIDGKEKDWGINPRYFNTECALMYELRNDSSNVYLILKSNEKSTQMQMLSAGFSVNISSNGAEPFLCTMNFKPVKQMLESDKYMSIETKDSVEVEGFSNAKGKIGRKENNNGVEWCKMFGREEQLVYEIRIALTELFGEKSNLNFNSNIPLRLKVSINGLGNSESFARRSMHSSIGRAGRYGAMQNPNMGGMQQNMSERMTNDRMGESRDQDMEKSGDDSKTKLSFSPKSFSASFVLSSK